MPLVDGAMGGKTSPYARTASSAIQLSTRLNTRAHNVPYHCRKVSDDWEQNVSTYLNKRRTIGILALQRH